VNVLENLQKIKIENLVDLIITQIRDLVSLGVMKPIKKLLPKQKFAEYLGVSRGQIKEAISNLQLYGTVKIKPQSGITVNGIGAVVLVFLMIYIFNNHK